MAKKVKLKSSALVNTISVFGEQESNEVVAIKPNKYKISFSMYATMDEEVDNIEALSINQNISYQRIIHLLKYYVNDCLWYDLVSARCIEKHFTATDNVFLITPEVNITYFTNCLYAKFNSICLPNIIVDSIQVLDTDTNITYDYEDKIIFYMFGKDRDTKLVNGKIIKDKAVIIKRLFMEYLIIEDWQFHSLFFDPLCGTAYTK